MVIRSDGSFTDFIPIRIVKGKDKKTGKQVMLMKGVASTKAKDADGQVLNPKGFDYSDFLKSGFMNWDHQSKTDPGAIIGRPTKAGVKGEKFLIEYRLFNTKKAKSVYELQKAMEEEGMSLGLSIEGFATAYSDPFKKNVAKAKITGCAVTPHPKNADTTTSIIKSKSITGLEGFTAEDMVELIKDMSEDVEVVSESDIPSEDDNNSNLIMKGKNQSLLDALATLNIPTDGLEQQEGGSAQDPLKKGEGGDEDGSEGDGGGSEEGSEAEEGKETNPAKDLLVKSMGEAFGSILEEKLEGILEKGLDSRIGALHDSQNEKLQAVGKLMKSLVIENQEMKDQLAKIGMYSQQPKSVTATDLLNKSFAEQGNAGSDQKTLSITQNRNQVLDVLSKGCGLDGDKITNESLAQATATFEASGVMNDEAQKFLKSEGYNVIG